MHDQYKKSIYPGTLRRYFLHSEKKTILMYIKLEYVKFDYNYKK